MADKNAGRPLSEEELQELVASTDAGSRNPAGAVGTFLATVALIWSLFQVVLASPVANYVLPGDWINNSRQFHLAFAMFLAYMAYPALKTSPRHQYSDPGLDLCPWWRICVALWFLLLSEDCR